MPEYRPTDQPRKSPNRKDLKAFRESMERFRDSGCRLRIREAHLSSNLLVASVSGHILMGPSLEHEGLGLLIDPELRRDPHKFPEVRTSSYSSPETFVFVDDHFPYFVFRRYEDLNAPHTLNRCVTGFYEIPITWFKRNGVLVKE